MANINATIADKLADAARTGKEAKFLYNGIEYEFTPDGIRSYLKTSETVSPASNFPGQWITRASSAVKLSLTGTTDETTVLTLTGVIPANALGPNGKIRITTLWSCTVNNSSVKNGRVHISGTEVERAVLTSMRTHQKQVTLSNRGVDNSQISVGPSHNNSYGSSAASVNAYTFDTTSPLTVTYTIQNAAVEDNSSLEFYSIETMYLP